MDFEELTGWQVVCEDARASLVRMREQQIWDRFVAKVTYRGTGRFAGCAHQASAADPDQGILRRSVALDPRQQLGLGARSQYAPSDSSGPLCRCLGQGVSGSLGQVDWKEWSLLHRRLEPEQIASVRAGASLLGIEITGGRNAEDRVLYLDNLAVFTEVFKPLAFEPRPQRGIALPPGHITGTNTGPGQLPFPTREQTILPDNLTRDFRTSVRSGGECVPLHLYEGSDGTLVYRLEPRSGTWSDLTARWSDRPGSSTSEARGGEIRPCAEGGVRLATSQGPRHPGKAEHLGSRIVGETVESRWRLAAEQTVAEVTFTYRLWNKSLVIDTTLLGRPGGRGAVRPRPGVGVAATGDEPLLSGPGGPAGRGRLGDGRRASVPDRQRRLDAHQFAPSSGPRTRSRPRA